MGFFSKLFYSLVILSFICCISFSCKVIVKEAPPGKPFVFDNKINLTGDLDKDAKARLTNELNNYWDDSLYARKVQQFVVRYVLKKPPVFDSTNIARSKVFMTGYLNSQGYYHAKFLNLDSAYTFDSSKEGQIRTIITFNIDPGKNTIIDSFGYDLHNKALDSISNSIIKSSFITPGKTSYSRQVIASELDRVVAQYRQRGYFLFTRDNVYALVDTVETSLLQITTDPFEQAQNIARAAQLQNENPTCTIVIKNRENPDSLLAPGDSIYFKQYYTGKIFYYPETGRFDLPDSLMKDTLLLKKLRQNNTTLYYRKGLFTMQPLREHTYLHTGDLYQEDNFYKTLNNFNRLGAWERADYRTILRGDTIDFHYFLTPAKKETVSFNVEASRNSGDFLSSANLFGIALNTSYINRNVWHRAIQSSTTLSNGIEFSFEQNKSLLQTTQISLTHSYSFPRLIIPNLVKKKLIGNSNKLDGERTLLSLSAAYSERKDFFRLRSFIGGWGYEWRKKKVIWQYKPLNVELYSLDTLPLLEEAFASNPYLRTAFNTGSIISQQLSVLYTYPGKNKNTANFIRLSGEEAGFFLGRIKGLQNNIYQYVKLEAEFKKLVTLRKTSLAMRAFGGIGYNYGKSERFGQTLPFFKQFVGGGPNSMRAWGLRLLGLGSSVFSDTGSVYRDRYGDLQLEVNAEYRYNMATFSAVKIDGALFTDVGNIWNLSSNPNGLSKFSFNRHGKDIAIGVGTGIRFDFNYFLIRVDIGIKLKDPARYANNGWLSLSDFTWKNYEYSTLENPPAPRNNYAIQLGIGLPF